MTASSVQAARAPRQRGRMSGERRRSLSASLFVLGRGRKERKMGVDGEWNRSTGNYNSCFLLQFGRIESASKRGIPGGERRFQVEEGRVPRVVRRERGRHLVDPIAGLQRGSKKKVRTMKKIFTSSSDVEKRESKRDGRFSNSNREMQASRRAAAAAAAALAAAAATKAGGALAAASRGGSSLVESMAARSSSKFLFDTASFRSRSLHSVAAASTASKSGSESHVWTGAGKRAQRGALELR